MSTLEGQKIAERFLVERLLGRGAMGEVYEAEQLSTGRRCAVKVLRAELVENQQTLARFEREARISSRLNHPHTITIYDSGRDGDVVFIAMELLDGHSLADVLRHGRIVPQRTVHIACQIAESLGDAHAHGIVHRDLKPENVILVERARDRDFVKVCDFGIARMYGSKPFTPMTTEGMVYGTPHYMSPEQLRAEALDGRSDVYALGVVLFEMLTGRRPFIATSPIEMATKHLVEDPPPFDSLGGGLSVSTAMERLVRRALAKDPTERWQSMDELRAALQAVDLEVTGPTKVMSDETARAATLPGDTEEDLSASTQESAAAELALPPGTAFGSAAEGSIATGRDRRASRFQPWLIVSLLLLLGIGVFGTTGILLSVRGSGEDALVIPTRLELDDGEEERRSSARGKSRTAEDEGERAAKKPDEDEDDDDDDDASEDVPTPATAKTTPAKVVPRSAGTKPRHEDTRRTAGPRDKGTTSGKGTGRLILNARPWAHVFLGKRSLGTTPLAKIELPAGRHTLTLKHDTAGTRKIEVEIKADEVTRHPLVDMTPAAP